MFHMKHCSYLIAACAVFPIISRLVFHTLERAACTMSRYPSSPLLSPSAAASYHQRQRGLHAMLLSMALFDELTCGFLVIALPLLRDRLHLSYAEAGLLFTVGALASLVVEPVINVVSDIGSKRIPILVGTVALAG